MELRLEFIETFERPWLLKRVDGKWKQHSHFFTKKEALTVKNLIEVNRYPKCDWQKTAMSRLLTEEEFKQLDKRQRYFNAIKKI